MNYGKPFFYPRFIPRVFLIVLLLSSTHLNAKKFYPQKGADGGLMILGSSAALQPGDTIVLRNSDAPYTYCYLGTIKGAEEKWITLINEGGVVSLTTGFDIEHCQFLKISGSGTSDPYGFSIKNSPGVAVTIHGKSSHIEVENVEADNAAFGCWIKNEASCDQSINEWVLDHISFHDYRFTNIKIEGFYAGSTDANNATRPIDCNGEQEFYKPSKLGNIKIYNGFIDGTGRPAIMLSNAAVGMSEIHHNVVRNVGREYKDEQGTGISLGLYTRAYVHHNDVSNTYTWGIASLGGSGELRIESNTVDSSGFLDGRTISWAQNILIDTRPTFPLDSTHFIIRNNILSRPGLEAANIEIYKSRDSYASGNIICNNKTGDGEASVRVAKGIKYRDCSGKSVSPKLNPKIILLGAGLLVLALVIFYFLRKRFRA